MGIIVSRRPRVAPTGAAQISVQPANTANSGGNSSSLENSPKVKGQSEKHHGSENASKVSGSRSDSRESQHSSLSNSMRIANTYKQRLNSGSRRVSRAGSASQSRPISSISRHHLRSGKAVGIRKNTMTGLDKLVNSSGLPFQRDIDRFDLNASGRSQRSQRTAARAIAPDAELGTILLLQSNSSHEFPATCCQLCGNEFLTLGIRVPLLLLCGHSYCSCCLEKACENYPSALKCGICSIITPLDQQTTETLPQNESILDLLRSKEFAAISSENHVEKCAECDRKPARVYCSECGASYCNTCNRQSHEGSRVRARHRPVPINLKPRPQPTCKKHPGQSCVLYCETEKIPMCVLCKFYGQHRFHRYELMSKVASRYCSQVSEKAGKLDCMEKEMDALALSMAQSVEEIDSSARKAQDRLERHFTELRKAYLASLERREAVLLTLVDRQVEIKQTMLEEMRMEVAAARARLLASKEEASRLLKLNPVLALLSRRHMDVSFDQALKQSVQSLNVPIQVEVPLTLLPDIEPGMLQALGQHGAVLQLPPKPWFADVSVTTNAISLQWEVTSEQSSDVTADRTLTYSLHCYADVPFKLKTKINFKKRFLSVGKLVTPESGFEDMSEYSAGSTEPVGSFPSLPHSLLGSQNISLITLGSGNKPSDLSSHDESHDLDVGQAKEEQAIVDREMKKLREEQENAAASGGSEGREGAEARGASPVKSKEPKRPGLVLKPTAGKNISALLPEPIRLPKPASSDKDPQLPQVVKPSRGGTRPPTQGTQAGGTVLNLPPLIISKSKDIGTDLASESATSAGLATEPTAGLSSRAEAQVEDGESDVTKTILSESCSSLSVSSTEYEDNQYTNMGRFLNGCAFEEIYCGEKSSFHYSGLVAGATYYFRLRCHNAAGWGPWSDTVKCMTTSSRSTRH